MSLANDSLQECAFSDQGPVRAPAECVILGIDARNDPVSSVVFDYRQQHVYGQIRQSGVQLVLCDSANDSRDFVSPRASQPQVKYISGEGHGTKDTFEGQEEPIFKVGRYGDQEVSGKIVHLLSCETAAELGLDMVSKGCVAFFGYSVAFHFPEEFAAVFLECDSQIDLGFALGLTADAVYQRTLAAFKQGIALLRAKGGPCANSAAGSLEEICDNLMCPSVDGGEVFGSRDARI